MSNDRQDMVQRCFRRWYCGGGWKTKAERKAWMEDMRQSLLEDLEYMIDANFSVEEAVYVRRLPHYGWLRRDIKHEKSDMGMELRAHDWFAHAIADFMEMVGLPRQKIRYGFPGEERPTGDRVAKQAKEHGMSVHQWILHCDREIARRNREASEWLATNGYKTE